LTVRRQRVDAEFREAALADLALWDITVDQHTDARAWGETLRLADRFRLTLYDATYLELAQRRGLPLATLDSELRTAAGAAGVDLLGAKSDNSPPAFASELSQPERYHYKCRGTGNAAAFSALRAGCPCIFFHPS
jgi:hypothetical protein